MERIQIQIRKRIRIRNLNLTRWTWPALFLFTFLFILTRQVISGFPLNIITRRRHRTRDRSFAASPSWQQERFLRQGPALASARRRLSRTRRLFSSVNNNNNNNDDESSWQDLDDLWVDDWQDGPEAFLTDEDLFALNDIDIIIPQAAPEPVGVAAIMADDDSTFNSTSLKLPPSLLSLTNWQYLADDLSYFYLQDELGLSEESMLKITMEAGSALAMKAVTIKEKVDLLRTTMNLSDTETRELIEKQPTLLHLSAKRNLAPTILFLVRQLDLAPSELRTIVLACPAVLCYSRPMLHKKLEFFRRNMGYSEAETRTLLIQEPKLWTASVDSGLTPRWRFLSKEMEIPPDKLRLLIQKNPRILLKSLDENLRPKLIFFFIMTLNMEPQEVLKILLAYPRILEYSLDNHLRPIVQYLISLDFSAREVARMLLKSPRLVTHSLFKIKHVVGYLRFELGLQAPDVRRVLYQSPQLVGLTTTNLAEKVDFLERACGSGTTIRKVIVGMPTLLNLSIHKNLKPKVDYLSDMLGKDELSLALNRLPTLLGYSLDKRIRPRLEQILEAGVDGGSLTVGIPMKEEAFDSWLKGRALKAERLQKEGQSTKEKKRETDDGAEQEEPDEDKRFVEEKGGRIVHWRRP
jgi:mTERF domain-containing protein